MGDSQTNRRPLVIGCPGMWVLCLFPYAILGGQVMLNRKARGVCLWCGGYTIVQVECCLLCALGIHPSNR